MHICQENTFTLKKFIHIFHCFFYEQHIWGKTVKTIYLNKVKITRYTNTALIESRSPLNLPFLLHKTVWFNN